MDWLKDNAWAAWLTLTFVLGGLELLSMDVIFVMLAVGALVGVVTALLGAPIALQVVAALATSAGLLALVRPNLIKKLHGGPTLRTGVDAMIGKRAKVLTELSAAAPGRVKIGGEEWTAEPYEEDVVIAAGESVDVVQIKGATAYVLRVPGLEPPEASNSAE